MIQLLVPIQLLLITSGTYGLAPGSITAFTYYFLYSTWFLHSVYSLLLVFLVQLLIPTQRLLITSGTSDKASGSYTAFTHYFWYFS